MMIFIGVLIATIVFVILATAIFCYIHALERRLEILESLYKPSHTVLCDELSLSLNNFSDK